MPDPDAVLADLARHPGWQVLAERAKAYQEKDAEVFAKAILRQREPIDQLAVARARGFWAGQRWMLRQVRHELAIYRAQEAEREAAETTT